MGKRGPDSKYINKFYKHDKAMMLLLSKGGVATLPQLHQGCGTNPDRMQKHVNSGYVEVKKIGAKGHPREVTRLTELGRKWCRNEFGITRFPRTSSQHINHDLVQTQLILTIPPEYRINYKPEAQILDEHPKLKRGTCVDGTFTVPLRVLYEMRAINPNVTIYLTPAQKVELGPDAEISIGMETRGSDYSDALMDAKIATAIELGCKAMITIDS